jgi:hypothetical protein
MALDGVVRTLCFVPDPEGASREGFRMWAQRPLAWFYPRGLIGRRLPNIAAPVLAKNVSYVTLG